MKESEALWAIAHHEPATNKEIAEALNVAPSNANTVLTRLSQTGMVNRTKRQTGREGHPPYEYTLSEDYER